MGSFVCVVRKRCSAFISGWTKFKALSKVESGTYFTRLREFRGCLTGIETSVELLADFTSCFFHVVMGDVFYGHLLWSE